jgi:hypothetical protein
VSFNLPEYEVFQMVSGDWMNYTRTFTPTNYKVYLRVAGSVPGQVQLGKVSGDASGPDQTVTPAGLFLLPNTGGANRYGYVAMTDATGQNEVTVALAGVSTVRLTSLGTDTNTGLNYLVFVPASASRIPPVVDIVAPTNGAEYPAGATIPVSVTASDPDGSVTNITISVSTLNSTNVLAVFGSSPASFSWSNVTDGIYTLTATATDNDGLKGLAMPVTIKVGNPPRPALFVVGPVPLGSGDAAVVDRLRFLGLPVVVKTAVEATSADADDKALVVISSTVLSGDVGTKFTASATPVLQWESALNDEFLLSATGGNLAGQDSIVITSEGAAHPLGAGLPEGTVVVRTTPTTFHTASDLNLAPGAIVIARAASPDNTSPVILAVDAGGILNNGSPAPARRVSMFWGNEGLDNVNAVGLSLFDAAVNWALGRISVRPKLHIARVGDTVIVSWPASISGETLQENSDLANPAGWVNSTRTIESDGTTKFVTIPAPSGNLFFRLVK